MSIIVSKPIVAAQAIADKDNRVVALINEQELTIPITTTGTLEFGGVRYSAIDLIYKNTMGQIESLFQIPTALYNRMPNDKTFSFEDSSIKEEYKIEDTRLKHFLTIKEPLKPPINGHPNMNVFAIRGAIFGYPLPPGKHAAIEIPGYILPQPVATDATGKKCYGGYEVVDDGKRQFLEIWFPCAFFSEALYPITIDPTITTNANHIGCANQRHIEVDTETGYIYFAYTENTTYRIRLYRSTNNGLTWSALTENTNMTGYHSSLAVKPGGGVLVVWQTVPISSGYGQIKACRWNGSSWDSVLTIYTNNYSFDCAKTPTVAYDAVYDDYHIMFSAPRSLNDCNRVFHARLNGGGTVTIAARTVGWQPSLAHNYHYIGADAYNGKIYSALNVNEGDIIGFFSTDRGVTFSYYSFWYWEYNSQGYTGLSYPNVTINRSDPNKVTVVASCKGNYTYRQLYVWYSTDGYNFARKQITSNSYENLGAQVGIDQHGWEFLIWWQSNQDIKFVKTTDHWFTSTSPSTLDTSPNYSLAISRVPYSKYLHFAYAVGSTITGTYFDTWQPPNAPVLTVKTNFDKTDAAVFGWEFSDIDPGDGQSAYQLLIKKVSDGSTVYDSTKTTASNQYHTLPADTLLNNTQYQWQVRTWDSQDVVGPYSPLSSFWCSTKPTLEITEPATNGATVSKDLVEVKWTYLDTEGEAQSKYQVKLTDSVGVIIFNSGELSGASAQFGVPVTLLNAQTYYVKVTVWDVKGVASLEYSREFVTSFSGPPKPRLSLAAENEVGEVTLAIANDLYDETTEGNNLTLSGGATANNTDAILDAQNEQAAKEVYSLGTGEYRFSVTESCTATVVDDLVMEVYNLTDAIVIATQTLTPAQSSTTYNLEWKATYNKSYEVRVRKATTTTNTIAIDKVQVAQVTTPTHNDIYRKLPSTDWQRIATGVAINGVWLDFSVEKGLSYTYKAVATDGVTATTTSDTQTAKVEFSKLLIHSVANPVGTLLQVEMWTSASQKESLEAYTHTFAGRIYPVVEYGEHERYSMTLTLKFTKKQSNTLDSLKALIKAKTTLCVREPHQPRKIYGVALDIEETPSSWGWTLPLSINAVDYSEVV